jgi:hypothetical protein
VFRKQLAAVCGYQVHLTGTISYGSIPEPAQS